MDDNSTFTQGIPILMTPTDPPIRLLLSFQQLYPQAAAPDWVVQAPDRDLWLAATRLPENELILAAPDLDARAAFSVRSARLRLTVLNRPLPRWARYAAGALVLLHDAGLSLEGIGAVVMGDEPAGPRYDYAIGLALGALAYRLYDHPCTAASLLDLLERVQRDYVG